MKLATLALTLLLSACGGAAQEQTFETTPLDPALKPTALVVLPIALTVPGTTALDVVGRSNALADLLLARTDLPILGPHDFSVVRPIDEVQSLASDTDALAKATELGFDLRQALTIRVLITENRATNVRDIQDVRQKDPKKQKTFRQHGLESVVRVEVSLLEVMRGRKVGGLTIETMDDPTDFEPGGDPRPGITAAVAHAIDKLFELSGPVLRNRGARRTRGDGLVDSVPALQRWSAPDLPSWNDLKKDKPDVVRDAEGLSLWDRFAPGLEARELFNATRTPGVLVRKVLPPLQPGDVITTVMGKPVVAKHQVDRLLQQCAPNACPVQVRRGGQDVELSVQWPVAPPVTPPTP